MPKSLLAASDGAELRKTLLDRGLYVGPHRGAREALHTYLGQVQVSERARAVDRIGWHDEMFVLPEWRSANDTGEQVILQTEGSHQNAFCRAGSLDEWQQHLARHAIGNSRLVFGLAAAFAAPALYLADGESGGFHFRGPSSIGKSTLLRLAGSVWGGGGVRGYLNQWRATDNGLEAVARNHCDVLLCLDELSQIDARSAGQTAYMLANGSGKARAARSGVGRKPAEWRVLFLSTGEIDLAEKVAEDGRNRTAGQEVRVIDIPADAGAKFGLFESLGDCDDPATLAQTISEAAKTWYGTAGTAFIDGIADRLDETREALRGFRGDFVAEYCPAGADGQVRRVCDRFALVAAAGELAIMLGILPFAERACELATARCFRDWLSARGTTGPAEEAAAIAQVRLFIEQHGDSRFARWDRDPEARDKTTYNRAGFVRPDGDNATHYVFAEAWKKEVCKGLDAALVARTLASRGMLETGSHGKLSISAKPPALGKSARFYVVTADIFEEVDDA